MVLNLWSDTFVSTAEWAENNIILGSENAHPGPLRLETWQKGVLDTYDDPRVKQISLMCSSQIGKTLQILEILMRHVDIQPRQILLFQPNQATMKRFIREKIDPLVQTNKNIDEKVKRTHQGNIPLDEIQYPGGLIFVGYSGSKASYRSVSAQLVLADEVDVYQSNGLDVANPITMLDQRMESYRGREKMVVASTPIDADMSVIAGEYESGTACVFEVPCPSCGIFHTLEWENVVTEQNDLDGQVRTTFAYLICPFCKEGISEDQRREIVDLGQWRKTNENPAPKHASFHISQLYSKFSTLLETAQKLDGGDFRGFTTQVLGRPYKNDVLEGDPKDHVETMYTKERWDTGLRAITCAVDVQGNRLELQVMHWYEGDLPYIVSHRKIERKVEEAAMWVELRRILRPIAPDMVFIDRAYKPDDVRKYTREHLGYFVQRNKVKLIKGSNNTYFEGALDMLVHPRSPKDRPLYLTLNVDSGKLLVADAIIRGRIRANAENVPEDFSDQITAEKLRMVTVGTKERPKWVKVRARNEGLDCAVYNYCALDYLGPQYQRKARLGSNDLIKMMESVHIGG